MHVRDILHESTLLAMHASIRYNMPRSHTYEDYVLMGSISMDSLLCWMIDGWHAETAYFYINRNVWRNSNECNCCIPLKNAVDMILRRSTII